MVTDKGDALIRVKTDEGIYVLSWTPTLGQQISSEDNRLTDRKLLLQCLLESSFTATKEKPRTEEVVVPPEPVKKEYVPPPEFEAPADEDTKLFGVKLSEVMARKSEQNNGIPNVVRQMIQYLANEGRKFVERVDDLFHASFLTLS